MMRSCRGICTALVLAGCGHATGIEGDVGMDVPDSAPDVPPEASVDLAGRGITFTMSFVTDIPFDEFLYAQVSDEMGHELWVSVSGPEGSVEMQGRCDICSCEECTGCPVCGPALPAVEMVVAGDAISFVWDGITYPIGTCVEGPGGPVHTCEDWGILEPGGYTATFCWSTGPAGAFPDGWIVEPVCDTVDFGYPVEGGVVQYVVNYGG